MFFRKLRTFKINSSKLFEFFFFCSIIDASNLKTLLFFQSIVGKVSLLMSALSKFYFFPESHSKSCIFFIDALDLNKSFKQLLTIICSFFSPSWVPKSLRWKWHIHTKSWCFYLNQFISLLSKYLWRKL